MVEDHHPASRRGLGFASLLAGAGLAGVGWWFWTWSRVRVLIDDHITANGPLPPSPLERSALYANGTIAEQQLSNDLSQISGLYPWAFLPLLLAAALALLGFVVLGRRHRVAAIAGVVVTAAAVVASLTLLWDPMIVAMDILE